MLNGTVKPETLASGNLDEFGESWSNRRTFNLSPSEISALTSISPTFLSSKFFESVSPKFNNAKVYIYGISLCVDIHPVIHSILVVNGNQ